MKLAKHIADVIQAEWRFQLALTQCRATQRLALISLHIEVERALQIEARAAKQRTLARSLLPSQTRKDPAVKTKAKK